MSIPAELERHYRGLAEHRARLAKDEVEAFRLTGELSETSPPPPREAALEPELGDLWHRLTGEG